MSIVFRSRPHAIRPLAPRTGTTFALLAIAGLGLSSTPAAAQVRLTNESLNGFTAVCTSRANLALVRDDDCSNGLTGNDILPIIGIYVGSSENHTFLDKDGDAEFDSNVDFHKGTTFNGGTQFNGQVTFAGYTAANQLNSTTIMNSGALTTNSLNAGSVNVNGSGRFGGAVSSDALFSGSALITRLQVAEASVFNTSVKINGALAITAGAAIDAGGNPIQNVGSPTAGTDAVNRNYVDAAFTGVQGSVTTLTNAVGAHETRIAAAETSNTQQDTMNRPGFPGGSNL